jgi:hypothetical protein
MIWANLEEKIRGYFRLRSKCHEWVVYMKIMHLLYLFFIMSNLDNLDED